MGIEPEKKRKNPFERVATDDAYYYITEYGNISDCAEDGCGADQAFYTSANYFNDKAFAKQVALHQLLHRKLLKFAYDNGAEDILEWDAKNIHYGIFYDCCHHEFVLEFAKVYKSDGVYFHYQEVAERALKEVVEPFMKEHPEFVW